MYKLLKNNLQEKAVKICQSTVVTVGWMEEGIIGQLLRSHYGKSQRVHQNSTKKEMDRLIVSYNRGCIK